MYSTLRYIINNMFVAIAYLETFENEREVHIYLAVLTRALTAYHSLN